MEDHAGNALLTQALDAVHAAVADLVAQGVLPLAPDDDAVLYGEGGLLDSLGLVALLVATEDEIERRMGVRVVLADDRALAARRSPFRTARALAEHVAALRVEARP